MAKKSAPALLEGPAVTYDRDSLMSVALTVKGQGFIPKSDLTAQFGPEKTTQAVAILFRDYRMLREVRRPWGENGTEALGYEWADRRFSKPETSKIPPGLGFLLELVSPMMAKYSDFQPLTVKCVYISPILGSVPVKDDNGDPTNVFERNRAGDVLILRYHQRAMASMALPMVGKEQAAARRIGFSIIRIPKPEITIVEHGIVEQGRVGGKGLRRSEQIADGTEFEIKAMIPTSVLSIAEFLQMLRIAGQHIGLSPGRSAGFGDFSVLEAE